MKASVLMLNDNPDVLGGGEKQLVEVAKAAVWEGMEVVVACISGSSFEGLLKAERIDSIPLSQMRSNPLAAVLALARISKERRIDLIHTHSFFNSFSGRLAGRLTGVPVVTTVHCQPGAAKRTGRIKRVLWLLRETLERSMVRYTSSFIAVSEAVAEGLVRQGASRRKIVVIPNGIDALEIRQLAAKENRDRQPREPFRLRIGTVARLDPAKGIEILVEAAGILRDRNLSFEVIIVGDGPERRRIEELVRHLDLEQQVVFRGYLDNPFAVLKTFDIHVVPSHEEGFGFTVLEAMALGRPVIATHVGGLVDLIEDGKTGLLVPPGDPQALADAIEVLANDSDLRKRLVDQAEKGLERFSVETMCSKTIDVYQGLL